jgi:transcription factor SPN1
VQEEVAPSEGAENTNPGADVVENQQTDPVEQAGEPGPELNASEANPNDDAGYSNVAGIFDEDDDDDGDGEGLPSFRKTDVQNTDQVNDAEGAVVRKKKKKRQHTPDEAISRSSGGVKGEEADQEDPYAGMTEAESMWTCLPLAESHRRQADLQS